LAAIIRIWFLYKSRPWRWPAGAETRSRSVTKQHIIICYLCNLLY